MIFPGWMCQPAGAFSLMSPAVPFCGRGHRSQAVLLPGVGKVPTCSVPLVSPGKSKGLGRAHSSARLERMYLKKCINLQEPKFSLPLSKFKMCSAQWSTLISHLKAFFSQYLISDRTTFHCWIKETTWEMLAKGLLESNFKTFEKPRIFSNSSTLRFSSLCYLDIRQTDLFLVHFQFCLTLHLTRTVNFPLLHKHGYYN